MKPYTITFSRRGKPDHSYQILAKDRDDAIDFCKRVHRVDFGKVISCRQVTQEGNNATS